MRTSAGHGGEKTGDLVRGYLACFVPFLEHVGSTGRQAREMEWGLLCHIKAVAQPEPGCKSRASQISPGSRPESSEQQSRDRMRKPSQRLSSVGQAPGTQGRNRPRARESASIVLVGRVEVLISLGIQ